MISVGKIDEYDGIKYRPGTWASYQERLHGAHFKANKLENAGPYKKVAFLPLHRIKKRTDSFELSPSQKTRHMSS